MRESFVAAILPLACASACIAQTADFSGGPKFPAEIGSERVPKLSRDTSVRLLRLRITAQNDNRVKEFKPEDKAIPTELKSWASRLRDLYRSRLSNSLSEHWNTNLSCRLHFEVNRNGEVNYAKVVRKEIANLSKAPNRHPLQGSYVEVESFEQLCIGVAESLSENPRLKLPTDFENNSVQVDLEVSRKMVLR